MATRSAGGDSKDTSQTTARQNTSSTSGGSSTSSAASVKAASPTTAVRSTGSDVSESGRSGFSGGNQQGGGGIAAAAQFAAPVLSTANAGNGNKNADAVDRSSSMNWAQFDDMVSGSPTRSMSEIAKSASFDPVDRTPGHNWLQLQDMLDSMTPAKSVALQSLSLPGDRTPWSDFVRNVQNGSLGVPGTAGYGKTYDPNSHIAFDPMAQDTAAMDRSLNRTVVPAGQALHDMLQGPYNARLAANGGVPPFEGALDTAGIIHALNAPYYKRILNEGSDVADAVLPTPVTRGVQTTPIHATTIADLDSMNGSPYDVAYDPRFPISAAYNGGWGSMTPVIAAPDGRTGVAPGYVESNDVTARTVNPDGSYSVPLQAIQAATGNNDLFATDGRVTTADGSVVNGGKTAQPNVFVGPDGKTYRREMTTDPKLPDGTIYRTDDQGARTLGEPAKPSAWDSVVDNTGKLLSHTGLGALVSGMFPDLWNGMGDAFKGIDNGKGGSFGSLESDPATQMAINKQILGDPKSGRGQSPFNDFIDLNGNGIDDRLEGVPATGIAAAANPGTDATGYSGNQFRSNRYATFPDMPPYRPGQDDEWNYFHDHLARGGVVGYSERDPRVSMIADAEDALHRGDHQHASITQFVDTFGPKALEHLNNNVLAGHRMRAGMPARQVVGPGGPTDDAVPAVIDGQHPAKLSSGEVVIPTDAVMGAGEGDPRVGAERLMALSKQLAAK